jgi:hypothetical protein
MPNTAPVRFAENGDDNTQRDLYFYAIENGTIFLTTEERGRIPCVELKAHLFVGGSFDYVRFEIMGSGQELEVDETFPNGGAYHIIFKEAV